MALQGTLDTFALPDVLRLLAATKKTGRLRITGGRGTGSVWAVAGEVCGVEATHAPHATDPVDALFELLRFTDGAFTFDAEAVHDDPFAPADVEGLLTQAEAQLAEWREIEAVVPSMDAYVTLRKALPSPELTIDQDRWQTLVAVGGGATVRRVADELCLAELPISRAIKDLLEVGLVDVAETAPAGVTITGGGLTAPAPAPDPAPRPLVASTPPDTIELAEPAPAPRARRAKPAPPPPSEPEVFVPLDLPTHGAPAASYDPPEEPEASDEAEADLAAAFPGLAAQAKTAGSDAPEVDIDAPEDEELARQLATLSPRAAKAIRAAAAAGTDEERDAALDEAESEDEPLNRGLLLKFLSSVKS